MSIVFFALKSILRKGYYFPHTLYSQIKVDHYLRNYDNSQMENLRDSVLTYLESLRLENGEYSFSESSKESSIYSNMYACLLKGLYSCFSEEEKDFWKRYFDSHQREDGLFYDTLYDETAFFYGSDGWGARHFIPHIMIVYDRIGRMPKYKFNYLQEYGTPDKMTSMLKQLDYKKVWASSNIIMNIGVAMQYARDRMGMDFDSAIIAMEDYLLQCINSEYGMWFEGEIHSANERNEMIRGYYHILPIFYYDGIKMPYADKAIIEILKSQNRRGGFDVNINSSACEDIDALDPLMRLALLNSTKQSNVDEAVEKAKKWILYNQNSDGGFSFQRDEIFAYGKQRVLSSKKNESNLFATWFRSVSLELINEYMCHDMTRFMKVPGYECPFSLYFDEV